MNIRSRLSRAERAAEAVRPPATCAACGGPRPGYNAIVVLVDEDRPPEPMCPDCGLLVDGDGRARSALPRRPGETVTMKCILL